MNRSALFKLGYGLYVLTAKDGEKDNGCIVNTVMQVSDAPEIVGVVAVNKKNYTHDLMMASKVFNVSVLTEETPFAVFERFGFQSGRETDKFSGFAETARSENGLLYLTGYSNAYLSFQVTDTIDFDSHTMFKSRLVAGEVLGESDSLTYAYYHRHVKPKPQAMCPKGYRCDICGYVYEEEELPADFICPWCKHGADNFKKIQA